MRTPPSTVIAYVLSAILVAGPISAAAAETQVAQAAPAPAASAAATTGTIVGTVLDSRGQPISGATVEIIGNGTTRTITTDGSGTFRVSVPDGLYNVQIARGGYQTSLTESVAVVAGTSTTLRIPLQEANLQSLRVIGSVTSSTSRSNPINPSASSVTTLNGDQIIERATPNLNNIVTELPGVSLGRGSGATPNTNFIVRGSILEARTTIDGHVLSSGVFGTYNTNYANSAIFQQVEVVKGAGLNGVNAGESPIGTVNLRTRDFTPTNSAYLETGRDSYGGGFYNVYASVNALQNNRLSVLGAKSYQGYRGTSFGYFGNRIGVTNNPVFNYNNSNDQFATIQWQGDLSYPYSLEAELAKIRYRFSNATSVTVQYLGLQGQYLPQGGSYASYYGNRTVPACFNGTTPSPTAAGCTTLSTYGAPYTQYLIGTSVPIYSWFPNSVVQNNEPYFSAELRTSFKNDTILVRPYGAIINRYISGDYENRYAGNGGAWYQVTNVANCQATFVAPSAANNGAKGPCFASNSQLGATAYIGNSSGASVVYPTTATAPVCTTANPCYTTVTGIQRNGLTGFGTPFSQPEIDRLHGVTFLYQHPVGDNLFTFSYDYNSDDTYKLTNDTTPVLAGCREVIGSAPNTPGTAGYQPTCGLATLPRTSIDVAPTLARHNDFALTGLIQARPKLQLALGAYLTNWKINYQIQDPTVTAQLGAQAPVSLIGGSNAVTHFDPHVGINWRPSNGVALRATAGSGITVPYAGQVSGFPNLDLPNGANNQTYTISPKNPQLQPETTVAYDLGGDFRLPDGGVFSVDAFNNTIHNVFVRSIQPLPASLVALLQPQYPSALGFQQALTINGPIQRNYGLEFSFLKNPAPYGFGYFLTGTFQRAYLDQLPPSIYLSGSSSLINNVQVNGAGSNIVPYTKGYGEIRYAFTNRGLATLGAYYEGSNNSTYGPAYTVFNSTVRVGIAKRTTVQLAAENLFNYNTGTFIGQATVGNGFVYPRQQIINGSLVPVAGGTTSVQIVQPRNIRISVQRSF